MSSPITTISEERRNIWRNWDKQIRLFAKYFIANANLVNSPITFLDVGCGIGSASHELHLIYPKIILFGCDNDYNHISECNNIHSKYAHFMYNDILEINQHYDVIYVSNVLEHIKNYENYVNHLLKLCNRLYIMVPYKETVNGVPVNTCEYHEHVNYFNKNTFDKYMSDSIVVEHRIIRTPYAWGHPLKLEILIRIKHVLKCESFDVQKQILYCMTKKDEINGKIPLKPFNKSITSSSKSFYIAKNFKKNEKT